MDLAVRSIMAARLEQMPGRPNTIQHDNLFSAQPPGEIYLRATLLVSDEYAASIFGADSDGQSQTITLMDAEYHVDVFGPAATVTLQGSGPVAGIVDLIKEWFRPGLRLADNQVVVTVNRARSFPPVPGVSRYQIPVRIRLQAQQNAENGG